MSKKVLKRSIRDQVKGTILKDDFEASAQADTQQGFTEIQSDSVRENEISEQSEDEQPTFEINEHVTDRRFNPHPTVQILSAGASEMLTELSHDTIVTFRNQCQQATASSRIYDRNSNITSEIQQLISITLGASDNWPAQTYPNWKTAPDDVLFTGLLREFPLKGQRAMKSQSLVDAILSLPLQLELDNTNPVSKYIGKVIETTKTFGTSFGNSTSLELRPLTPAEEKNIVMAMHKALWVEANQSYPLASRWMSRKLSSPEGIPETLQEYLEKMLKSNTQLARIVSEAMSVGCSLPPRNANKRTAFEERRRDAVSTKPSAPNKRKHDAHQLLCPGCGNSHAGECRLKAHPNWNHTSASWGESAAGKLIKAIFPSQVTLPARKMLNKDRTALIPWDEAPPLPTIKKQKVRDIEYLLHLDTNNLCVVNGITRQNEVLRVLLDTGASTDFINARLYDRLKNNVLIHACKYLQYWFLC